MEHTPVAATEGALPSDHEPGLALAGSLRARVSRARPATPEGWLQAAALTVLATSLAVAATRAVQAGWIPVGDEALIEMRVRDVPGHLPLLGVYSRFGWSHPGPAQFVLLALPYRLLGSVSAALLVGALAGHLLVVGSGWWIARRIDRLAGVAVLVAFELVLVSIPADLVRSAWNPYVALLMAGLMVITSWGVAERQRFAAVMLLPLGTLLVQSHVGNLPLVVMSAGVAFPLALWWHREPGPSPVPWRSLTIGASIAALMWVPALVEQFSADEGNLTRMVQDLSDEAPRVGIGPAVGLSSSFFRWWPAWTDQRSLALQIADTGRSMPVWLLVPLAGSVVAWRHRDRVAMRGLVIGLVGVASTVVAASSIKGIVYSYLVVGHRSAAAALMAISFAALARGLPDSAQHVVGVALAALAVVLAATIGVLQWSAHNPSAPFDPTVRAVATAVEEQAAGDAVFVTSTGDDPSRDVASGLLLQLERAGVRATTVRDEDWRMGAHRTSDRAPSGAIDIRIAPIGSEQQLADGGYRVLLDYRPSSADEVASIDRLEAEREAVIREGEVDRGTDQAAAIRFIRIQELAAQIDALRDGRVPTLVGVRD